MNDYIRREAALKKLQMQLLDLEADQDKGEYSELCENRGARDALDEAIYDIRTIKTADVQPVKHGRWINVDTLKESKHWKCSCCKGVIETAHCCYDCYYNYCPNCGADMKEGES